MTKLYTNIKRTMKKYLTFLKLDKEHNEASIDEVDQTLFWLKSCKQVERLKRFLF